MNLKLFKSTNEGWIHSNRQVSAIELEDYDAEKREERPVSTY